MNETGFEPGEPARAAPAPHHRGGTPKNEERRQAGTPTALERNIDNAIDENQHNVNGSGVIWISGG
jgi:hypothetical protein